MSGILTSSHQKFEIQKKRDSGSNQVPQVRYLFPNGNPLYKLRKNEAPSLRVPSVELMDSAARCENPMTVSSQQAPVFLVFLSSQSQQMNFLPALESEWQPYQRGGSRHSARARRPSCSPKELR